MCTQYLTLHTSRAWMATASLKICSLREAGRLAAVTSGHQSSSDKGLRRENPKINHVTLALLADAFFTGIKWLGQASIPPPRTWRKKKPEGLELLWSKVS